MEYSLAALPVSSLRKREWRGSPCPLI